MSEAPFKTGALLVPYTKARALGRVVVVDLKALDASSIPADHRALSDHLIQRIERGDISDEGFLRDLDSVISLLNNVISSGTHYAWIVDDYSVSGGYYTMGRSDYIAGLAAVADRLEQFHNAVIYSFDLASATRDTAALPTP